VAEWLRTSTWVELLTFPKLASCFLTWKDSKTQEGCKPTALRGKYRRPISVFSTVKKNNQRSINGNVNTSNTSYLITRHTYKPRHDKNQRNAFATRMDPDRPAHSLSLIRIHAVPLPTLLQVEKLIAMVWIHAGRKRTMLVLLWRSSFLPLVHIATANSQSII
jgi:hypothetical protein